MHNIDIRSALKENRVYSYEVAVALGMGETSFSRMMTRREISDELKQRIFKIIKDIRNNHD